MARDPAGGSATGSLTPGPERLVEFILVALRDGDGWPAEDAVRRLATELGDVVVAFLRTPDAGPPPGARRSSTVVFDIQGRPTRDDPRINLNIAALHAPEVERLRRWRSVLAGSGPAVEAALAPVRFMGQTRILPPGPWPIPGSPAARPVLVPIRSGSRIAGVLVVLRDPDREAFRPTEALAVEAVAAQIGAWLRARHSDAELAAVRELFEIFREGLHILGGQLDAALALQPLAVQARQVLGARSVAFFTLEPEGRSARLVAGAGLGSAGARGAWAREDNPFLERPLFERGGSTFEDLGAMALRGDAEALRLALGGAGSAQGFRLQARQDSLGVALFGWGQDEVPAPAQRAFTAHVAELASFLVSHARLARQAIDARAAGRLASGLAAQRDALVRQIVHDLRNAVHIMGLAAEEIDRKAADPDRVRAALAPLVRQGEFIASYLEAKLRSLEATSLDLPAPASLEGAFREAAEHLGPRVAEEGRRLRVERCEPATLRIAQVQLREILERLIEIAVDLADPGGTIALWAAVADGWCTVMLEDEGPGLAFETLQERLRRPEAKGGLAAIEEVIAAAGGQLGIRSRPGDRTSFHVGLPTVEWGAGTLQ